MNERARAPEGPTFLDGLIREKKVVVCCGAGGVGKTTTSAAIALAAAQHGRRALVLTIDPARRLAEAMGIPIGAKAPAPVPASVWEKSGVKLEGTLDAWMLDPRAVFEQAVRRLVPNEAAAQKIFDNRLYGHLSGLVAGMQEYTAAEALYDLSSSGAYDFIVLDTPPSRNALEFLDAPRKLSGFLDERVVGVFMPAGSMRGRLFKRAADVVGGVFGKVFGDGFFGEIQGFIASFSSAFTGMREHAEAVRALLTSKDCAFVLVTAPEPAAIAEAEEFQRRIEDLGLPFAGYVLNRSWAYTRGFVTPDVLLEGLEADAMTREAFGKLGVLAKEELGNAVRDRALLAKLRARTTGADAIATPHLGGAVEDLRGLARLAECIAFGKSELG